MPSESRSEATAPEPTAPGDARGPKVRVHQLDVGFAGEPILEDLSFDVHERALFAILGGSGSGKSTVLRHLIGLQQPLRGSVAIRDVEPFPPPPDSPPPFGVAFQSGALFGSLTLHENVALPIRKWTRLSTQDIDTVALARLRLVGLGGYENHLPAEISGGMRKRAGIARALALEPDLLFLDEPSAGLDPVSAVDLDDLLVSLNRHLGVTIVFVTHELDSLFRIADHCVMLDTKARGIIARGDPRHLRDESQDPRVHRFFNRLPSNT